MEFLAAFGFAARELFDYNRENYQFDQSQRLDRELMRLEMQIKRFELFREDIRDLVELCVGRMEMYHLVGAMFLEFCVALYCEGRLHHRAPPFVLGLFYLSVASSFLYLVLAVWLSMHASICAHSFGVRLLTRYVRLPIPSIAQMGALNARLTEFEQQGAKALRVPFMGNTDQQWRQRVPEEPPTPTVPENSGAARSSRDGPAPTPATSQAYKRDLLGQGEQALWEEEAMMKTTNAKLPGKHVVLFRRLQCKWQVYDAYSRVCMSLGCNMILQSICYYIVNITLFQYGSKSCCIAVVTAFQCAALMVAYIDVAKIGKCNILMMQMMAIIPCYASAISIMVQMHNSAAAKLPPDQAYYTGPVCFLLVAIWFECLLRLAWPSKDEATLPRRFRAVLFLDVFEEAIQDPTKAEEDGDFAKSKSASKHDEEEEDRQQALEHARAADEALFQAHCALRRWEAVPAGVSEAQLRRLMQFRSDFDASRQALNGEVVRLATLRGCKDAAAYLEEDYRPWDELSDREQAEDPMRGFLLGPFEHPTGVLRVPTSYHFDLERQDFVWQIGDGQQVLTLDEVQRMLQDAERKVRHLLEGTLTGAGSGAGSTTGTSSDEGHSMKDGLRKAGRSKTMQFVSEAVGGMGGPYVPQRLPWKVVYGSTRAVQFAWLLVAVLLAVDCLPNVNFKFDTQIYLHHEGEGEEGHEGHGIEGAEEGAVEGHEGHEGHGIEGHEGHGIEGREEPHGHEGDHEGGFEGSPEASPGGSPEGGPEGSPEGRPEHSGGHEGHTEGAARRLRKSSWASWFRRFQPVQAAWPQRELFRTELLACLPDPAGSLLVGTPYEFYHASAGLPSPRAAFDLQPMPKSKFRVGTAAFCANPQGGTLAADVSDLCLLGAATPDGVAVWPFGAQQDSSMIVLPTEGDRPWQMLAGAILPCSKVSEVLPPEGGLETGAAPAAQGWCLLLVGWDGERLPVAALPLPGDKPSELPVPGQRVVPAFDVPLHLLLGLPGAKKAATRAEEGAKEVVVALNMEPQRGRLWAVLADGSLQAWELVAPKSLGRWWPDWPTSGSDDAFQATAVCEETRGGRFFVAGQSLAEGAQLLRAPLRWG